MLACADTAIPRSSSKLKMCLCKSFKVISMKGAIKFSTLAAAVLAASMTMYSTNATAAGQADIDAALAAAREAVAAAQRAEAAAVEAKRAAEAAQAKAEAESARAKAIVDQVADGKAAKVDVGWKPSFDFHGYFRAGIGQSSEGSNIKWNATKVGRLGNENDTYSELEFGTEVYKVDGVSFYIDSMMELSSDGHKDSEGKNDDDFNVDLRQFNLQVKGLIPGQPNAVLWAGKRYYQRADIHVIDSKYINISGSGAGLEYLQAGPGTFSFAWIRADQDDIQYQYEQNGVEQTVPGDLNVNYLDARYAGWAPWQGAWTQFQVAVAIPHGADQVVNGANVGDEQLYDNGAAFMGTAELSQNFSLGYNKTVLQYFTKGLARNAVEMWGGSYEAWMDMEDAKGFSIINTGEINITDNFSLSHVLHYGYSSDVGVEDNHSIIRAVARAGYQLTNYTRLLAEVGSYWEDVEYKESGNDASQDGQKYTLAYAIAPGKGLMSRPELRFYASYFVANGDELEDSPNPAAYSIPAVSGGTSDDTEWAFGVQAEAWW